MNKTYKKPSVKVRHIDGELMVQASLDPNMNNQSIVSGTNNSILG